MSKARIIELQKSLRIAREALERIRWGTTRAQGLAEEALDEMRRLEPKRQIQGIVGHTPSRKDLGREIKKPGTKAGLL